MEGTAIRKEKKLWRVKIILHTPPLLLHTTEWRMEAAKIIFTLSSNLSHSAFCALIPKGLCASFPFLPMPFTYFRPCSRSNPHASILADYVTFSGITALFPLPPISCFAELQFPFWFWKVTVFAFFYWLMSCASISKREARLFRTSGDCSLAQRYLYWHWDMVTALHESMQKDVISIKIFISILTVLSVAKILDNLKMTSQLAKQMSTWPPNGMCCGNLLRFTSALGNKAPSNCLKN